MKARRLTEKSRIMTTRIQSLDLSAITEAIHFGFSGPIVWFVVFVIFVYAIKTAINFTKMFHDYQARYTIGDNFLGGSNRDGKASRQVRPGRMMSGIQLSIIVFLLLMWVQQQSCERETAPSTRSSYSEPQMSVQGGIISPNDEFFTIDKPGSIAEKNDLLGEMGNNDQQHPRRQSLIYQGNGPSRERKHIQEKAASEIDGFTAAIYTLQLLHLSSKERASEQLATWKMAFPDAEFFLCEIDGAFKLLVGNFASREGAMEAANSWKQKIGSSSKPFPKLWEDVPCLFNGEL